MNKDKNIPVRKVREDVWEVTQDYKDYMRKPARIYAAEALLDKMRSDLTMQQTINIASLPGIEKYSMVMPDGHQGYGFPIGGVAATDFIEGVISPGGVGYDINCGVRLIRTNLMEEEVRPHLSAILDGLFEYIPAGLGLSGKVRLSHSQLDEVLSCGSEWCIENGYGWVEDIERTEEGGRLEAANTEKIDEKSKKRGAPQLGTLGSGNHFLEVQAVDEIFDERVAKAYGIEEKGQVTILVHTGGRGFSHGVCSFYLREFEREMSKDAALSRILGLERELACAYLNSDTGMDYFEAMCSCANYAFANRQLATHWIREVFDDVFQRKAEDMEIRLVYDIAHNIAKAEEHEIAGKRKKLCVHRKGATRAFPAGDERLPPIYQSVGQPVLIPGSMGTRSFLAVGTEVAKEETFGSCAHGSGREMSRTAAMRKYRGGEVRDELAKRGVMVKARERSKRDVRKKRGISFDKYGELAEEVAAAYKDPEVVVRSCEVAGIARKVAAFRPIGVIKG
jgi:tRNA-splicing ligase RtcB